MFASALKMAAFTFLVEVLTPNAQVSRLTQFFFVLEVAVI